MERVSVDRIDCDDRTFCISYPIPDDRLIASIRQFGILSPLILLAPAPFRIVTGFRRLEAALQLGISEVPCITEEMDQGKAVLLAINDNIMRPLNVVEKAFCVEKMTRAGLEKEEFDAMMRTIGLQSHEKMVTIFLALAKSDEALKAFAAQHNLATHELTLMLSFPPETRSRLIAALSSLHLTAGTLREIIELARLVFIKGGSIPFDDLEGLSIGDEVRAILKCEAYPLLSKMEERLKAIKGGMHLPPGISVATDPGFERSNIEIRFTARNEGEVQGSIDKLQQITDNGDIRSIFDLISSDPNRN
jgi:ParB family chromosome partitioning protein